MKQDKGVYAFKNRLRNYQYFLSRINYFQEQVDDCYDKLGASPHSVDFSKIQTHTPMSKEVEHRIRENIEFYLKKQKFYVEQIDYIERTLEKMPVEERKMASDIFILGETSEAVAKRNYISATGMAYRINKAIKKALED